MQTQKLSSSFKCAFCGIWIAIKTQRNMKIHLVATVLVFSMALYLKISIANLLGLLLAIALVWVAEMLNTALEAVVDLITDAYHPLAKTAKDVAAGAALVAVIFAVCIGILVFGPYLVKILDYVNGGVK